MHNIILIAKTHIVRPTIQVQSHILLQEPKNKKFSTIGCPIPRFYKIDILSNNKWKLINGQKLMKFLQYIEQDINFLKRPILLNLDIYTKSYAICFVDCPEAASHRTESPLNVKL